MPSSVCAKYRKHLQNQDINHEYGVYGNTEAIFVNYDVGIKGVEYIRVRLAFTNEDAPEITASNFRTIPRHIDLVRFGNGLKMLNSKNDADNIPFNFSYFENELLIDHAYPGVAIYVNEPKYIDGRVDDLLGYISNCMVEINKWF